MTLSLNLSGRGSWTGPCIVTHLQLLHFRVGIGASCDLFLHRIHGGKLEGANKMLEDRKADQHAVPEMQKGWRINPFALPFPIMSR